MNTRAFFLRLKDFLKRNPVKIALAFVFGLVFGFALYYYLQKPVIKEIPTSSQAVVEEHAPFLLQLQPAKRQRIAIVIDDVGVDLEKSAKVVALPGVITLSYLPYAPHIQEQVDKARAAGHQILLHLPMEPISDDDPGPHALYTDMSDDELRGEIAISLDAFTGYIGVNNHMGSRFTADERGMRVVIGELKKRGLIFLDSRTSIQTRGEDIAEEMGVATTRRHVFLDDVQTEEGIEEQFKRLMQIADMQNYAVAIGHPHPLTVEMIKKFLPVLMEKFQLVPLNELAE